MNQKQREKLLLSESKLDDFLKVQKRVKFYALHLDLFIETKNLDDLNLVPPKQFHAYIQELRVFEHKQMVEECSFLLLRLLNIAKKLASIFISLPKAYADLVWIIRDILGRDPELFDTLNLSRQQINIINIAISSKHPEYWPFLILARYISPEYQKSLSPLVIGYASVVDSRCWEKTLYADETLVFLKSNPQQSLKTMSAHLIHPECDDPTADTILGYMSAFSDYDYLVIDEIVDYLESVKSFSNRENMLVHLMALVQSRDVASILLPYVSIILKKNGLKSRKNLFDSSNRVNQLLLMFYGHLQAIVNRDI